MTDPQVVNWDKYFRLIFEHGFVGAAIVSVDGQILSANQAYCKFVGYEEAELLKAHYSKVIEPEDLAGVTHNLHGILTDKTAGQPHKRRYRHKAGHSVWGLAGITVLRDQQDRIEGFIVQVQDITSRELAEKAILRGEERLKGFLAAASDWFWEMDKELRFSFFSNQFEAISGVPASALLGKTREETGIPGVEPDQWRQHLESLKAHRPFRDFIHPRRKPDGSLVYLSINGTPIYNDAGEFQGYRGTGTDITARIEAEDEIRRSKALLAHATENLSETFALWDEDDRLVLCNRAFRDIHRPILETTEPGARFEDNLRASLDAGLILPDQEDPEKWLADRLRRHQNPSEPFEIRRSDGTWLLISEQKLPDGGQVTIGTNITSQKNTEAELHKARAELEVRVRQRTAELETANRALIEEIAERKMIDTALHDSEAQLRLVTDNIPALVAYMDKNHRYVFVNKVAEAWYGRPASEIVGKSIADVLGAEADLALLSSHQPVLQGRVINFETEFDYPDGVKRIIEVTDIPDFDDDNQVRGYFAMVLDVTEMKKAHEQLRQAQKMEAVGQLTGGVAHDFNNLLTVVLGNLEMLVGSLRNDAESEAILQSALRAARRGAELTRRLLAFSRRQALVPKALDINRLVQDLTRQLLYRTLGEEVRIQLRLAGDLRQAIADPAQLESALLNLALNARDAMPDGGTLTIETVNASLDEDYLRTHVDAVPGRFVVLVISDTGHGMPPDISERAIEPFFTTKDVGQGSGLGLSMVYGFAKQSRGHLVIYSEVGEGTSIKLYLPVVERNQGLATAAPENRTGLPRGGETILVVEDDSDVRRFVCTVLTGLGYQILQAEDGLAALALLRGRDLPLDLLLTDVVLPGGLRGPHLADWVREQHSAIVVLYMSGYTENVIVHDGRLDEGVDLLNKPFSREMLAERVRAVLDAR